MLNIRMRTVLPLECMRVSIKTILKSLQRQYDDHQPVTVDVVLFLKQILRVTEENNKMAVFIWLEMVGEMTISLMTSSASYSIGPTLRSHGIRPNTTMCTICVCLQMTSGNRIC